MIDIVIAKRYAEAFLESLCEDVTMQKAVSDLQVVKNEISGNNDLRLFLASSEINNQEKNIFLNNIFRNKVSMRTMQFLVFLIDKGYIGEFSQIADAAADIYQHIQVSEGIISSACVLDNSVVSRIRNILETKLRKKINFKTEVNPGLISGIAVTVDNVVIDGTIKRKIEELREKLMSIKVV